MNLFVLANGRLPFFASCPSPGARRLPALFLTAVFLVGCQQETPVVDEEKTPIVRVHKVEARTFQPTLKFTGSVISQSIARVHPEVTGTVQKIHFRVGDEICQGDVLAELDPADFQLELEVASAERLKAQAELDRIERGYRPEDVEAASRVYENALALFRAKERNMDRNRTLFESGTMTERDWTVFVEEHAAAAAMMAKASAELSKMERGYETYDIRSASASYLLAKAREDLASRRLEQTLIRSPIDGVVSMRNLEVGQLVASANEIFEIQDTEQIWLQADASLLDAPKIRPGQRVELQTDSRPGAQPGHVDRVAETLNPDTRSLRVWFAWASGAELPPVGSFANATAFLDPLPQTISLQREWIHLSRGEHFVWTLNSSVLARRRVAIGEDLGDEVTIAAGLVEGDEVVVSPPAGFEEGMVVEKEVEPEPAPLDEEAEIIISVSQSSGS